MVPRCGARRGVRHRHRPAGQAAQRRPAAARALPPGPGLQPGPPGLLARQDGSLDRAHHQRRRCLRLPGLPRRHPGRRAGRLGGQPGRARTGRRAAPGPGRPRGQRAGAGRHPACHRPRCVPGRTAGTDRPVHPAGVAWLPGRRHRSWQSRPGLPDCARGRGPHRVEPAPAGRGVQAGGITCPGWRHHPAAPARRRPVLPGRTAPAGRTSRGAGRLRGVDRGRRRRDPGHRARRHAAAAPRHDRARPLCRRAAQLTGDVQVIRCLPPSGAVSTPGRR